MSEGRHEYLARRVHKDLALCDQLLKDALMTVVLSNGDVHGVPWHDEERLAAVAGRLSGIVNGWGHVVKARVEDSLSTPTI